MEPILNSQLPEFSVQAFHNWSFNNLTNYDIIFFWEIILFYHELFYLVCSYVLFVMYDKYF